MDERKASWILEFVLRQPLEDWLVKMILLRLPIPRALDPRLKKIFLLRRLSSDLSSAGLSCETLRSLELLEELDRSLGATGTSEAMIAAYSAVAAELTAAPLRLGRQATFFECVNRIWNCRVADLEQSEARGLVGEGLRQWRKRMEQAVVSDKAQEWVMQRDTGGEATGALREYVRVALEEIGPPLLELAASCVDGKPGTSGRGADQQIGEMEPDVRIARSNVAVAATPSAQTQNPLLKCRLNGANETNDADDGLPDATKRTTMQKSAYHGEAKRNQNQIALTEATAVERTGKENLDAGASRFEEGDEEDSIEPLSSDGSQNPTSSRLPSPRNRKVSPLELHEPSKFARRRKIKRWTPQEEGDLREAVKKYGLGNWKLILHCYPGAFGGRTEVDLKDKWRNLTRYRL